jgi:hypothetical protein
MSPLAGDLSRPVSGRSVSDPHLGVDTGATPAYVKIAYIEKVSNLVHLRVGDDPADLWPLVKLRKRESVAAR